MSALLGHHHFLIPQHASTKGGRQLLRLWSQDDCNCLIGNYIGTVEPTRAFYGVLGKRMWSMLPRSQCEISKWVASLLAFTSTSIGLGRPTHHHRCNVPMSSVDSQGSHTSLQRTWEVFLLYGSRWQARRVMRVFDLLSALQERALSRYHVPHPSCLPQHPRSVLSCGAPIRALRAKGVVLTLFFSQS